MTAKQAKMLKRGDKVIRKRLKSWEEQEVTTVEYVSFNPTCNQYFIATTDGWGGYHKQMELVKTHDVKGA